MSLKMLILDAMGSLILFQGFNNFPKFIALKKAPMAVAVLNIISFYYFPSHNWFIKGRGMYCSVYGKVHIKDPLLLIEKSSLCGGSGFPSKKCVNVTI